MNLMTLVHVFLVCLFINIVTATYLYILDEKVNASNYNHKLC